MYPKGEMPEWSNGAVSKTVVRFVRAGGSNPSFSAIPKAHFAQQNRAFLFPFRRKFIFVRTGNKKDRKNRSDNEGFWAFGIAGSPSWDHEITTLL